MRMRVWSVAGLAVLAGALVLLSPTESQAQRRGGFGGYGCRGGWSGGIGYNSFGGFSAGIGYGQPYGYGGYGYGYPGYGYGGYGLGYGGYRGLGYGYGGYGLGYGGYSYPSNYGYANYSYPSYYGGDYSYGTPSFAAYNPSTTGYQSFYPSDTAQAPADRAVITVTVQQDAQVWFDGAETQQRGPMRVFQTPALEPGRTYTYQVRARWTGANGKEMDLTRPLQVQAGKTATLDFGGAGQQQQNQQPQVQQNPPNKQEQQPPPPQ